METAMCGRPFTVYGGGRGRRIPGCGPGEGETESVFLSHAVEPQRGTQGIRLAPVLGVEKTQSRLCTKSDRLSGVFVQEKILHKKSKTYHTRIIVNRIN